jgi:hypothetical protein
MGPACRGLFRVPADLREAQRRRKIRPAPLLKRPVPAGAGRFLMLFRADENRRFEPSRAGESDAFPRKRGFRVGVPSFPLHGVSAETPLHHLFRFRPLPRFRGNVQRFIRRDERGRRARPGEFPYRTRARPFSGSSDLRPQLHPPGAGPRILLETNDTWSDRRMPGQR